MEKNISEYLNNGIQHIVSDVLLHTIENPRETKFLLSFRTQVKHAERIRADWEKKGTHIPVFLISSIAHSCNLFCKGCYARKNGICGEKEERKLMTDSDWVHIFDQAAELGIGFHLLAGGEPLTRRNVLELAAGRKDTVFPIFTNGTLIDDSYAVLFDTSRNLIPVISMEGTEDETDERRGKGTYRRILDSMKLLAARRVLFGVSLTVTTANTGKIVSDEFIDMLKRSGCRLVFFIEYVPVEPDTEFLAFDDTDRERFELRKCELQKNYPSVLFLSFPGDEEKMGGCLAGGRGFFHINPYGDAEPCPFSPYSDCNIKDHTLLEALQSRLFRKLDEQHLNGAGHSGGCALFEQRDKVSALCENKRISDDVCGYGNIRREDIL